MCELHFYMLLDMFIYIELKIKSQRELCSPMTMAYNQRTLAQSVHFKGVGVHSGKEVNLTLKPAPPNSGINFRRVDLPATPQIKAHFNRVVDTSLATVIGEDGCIVSTIEHLMACLAGLSIDNVVAELDDYEMPIMDGSAALFTQSIRKAGIVEQNAARVYFAVNAPIKLEKDGKSVCLNPADRTIISCTIEFAHPVISTQTYSIDLTEENFEREICQARTFGFLHELELMKFYGLAKGGSLDNAVVLDQNGVINEGGLRYADEFVRHKILDCIGDFSLLGLPIIGHVELFKSGHHFNHEFLKEFFAQKASWETTTLAEFERSRNIAPRLGDQKQEFKTP
jgi:UDP-3-O-[3-hydroxymyristoyl] N-acetylglucosamine deacetylase